MQRTIATKGAQQVKTMFNEAEGPFMSVVCVDHGATVTNVSATHSTLAGAKRWAERQLAR